MLAKVRTPTEATYKGVLQFEATFIEPDSLEYLLQCLLSLSPFSRL